MSSTPTEVAAGAGLLPRLRGVLPDLAPAERRVGEFLLGAPAAASLMTITELATACDVSETTVVRFCNHVGVGGFRELRFGLAVAAAQDERADGQVGGDIARDATIAEVIATVGASEARAIQETATALDPAAVEGAVEAIVRAGRVELFGIGASALVAEDLQQKLHRIGRGAFASRDPHAALTSAALLAPGDAAVGISHTGTTTDTIEPLVEAGRRGATTIAITNGPRSPIARAADHVLTTAAVETTFRAGAMASRTAQLVVVDCLFVGVAQRSYDRSLAALERTFEAVRGRREGRG